MADNFEEKIANAFIKVKEDMNFLRAELDKVKRFLFLKNKEVLSLKSEIQVLNELISKLKEQINTISTGNERVINNHQQSSTMTTNDFSSRKIFAENQKKPLRMLIENKFRSLTDMEFTIFMAVYQLEEELGRVTYQDIARKFNLTEATVRNHATNLINRGVPIDKERLFNKKTYLYINKDFRELNIASKLLELRQNPKNTVEKQ